MNHPACRKRDLGSKVTSAFGCERGSDRGGLAWVVFIVVSFWLFVSGGFAQAQRANFAEIQKLFMRASEAEKAGDLDSAIKQYQEILLLRPDLPEIHNKLGFIYFIQDKYPEAIQAFQNALRLKPELFPSNLGLGMSLFRYNAFEEAISPLMKAHALNPTDPQAIFFLGSTYVSLERFEDAVPLFLQFVRISPQDQDGLYALTMAAEQLYVKSYVNLAGLYPNSARARQVEAQRLAASKKWDEAIAEFQKVLAIPPPLEQIHLALGDMYAAQGLTAQAKEEYLKELEINPYDPLARDGLEKVISRNATRERPAPPVPAPRASGTGSGTVSEIHALVQSRDCAKAVVLMNSIGGGGPDTSVPWQWKVQCLMQLSEYESLLNVLGPLPPNDTELLYWKGLSMQELTSQSYAALARLEPDSARVHELAGRLASESDDEPTALRELMLAEARNPDLIGIHYAIGHILMRNRQLPEAVNEFLAELKADPYNPVVQCELGSTYLKLRDPDKAISLLEAGLERRPALLDAHRDLGRAYGQKGNWEKAITQFHIVADASPSEYSIHMLIGDAYRKLGRIQEAEAEFRKGRELQAADMTKTQGLAKAILNPDKPQAPSPETQTSSPDEKEPH